MVTWHLWNHEPMQTLSLWSCLCEGLCHSNGNVVQQFLMQQSVEQRLRDLNRSSSCWWCSTIPPPALSISTLSKIFQFAIWCSNQDNLTVFSVTIEHLKMFSLFKVDSRSHQVKGSGYRRSRSHSWVSVKVPATLSMNSLSQVINRWLYLQGGSHANCPGSPELSWLLYLECRLNNLWLLIFRDGTQYCYFFVSKCICEQCIWVPQECLQNLMILK